MGGKAVFNWSGGKDSAMALHRVLLEKEWQVDYLLTSVNAVHNRISMHGVRRELLMQQAASIGIPLEILEVPGEVSMQEYDALMRKKMTHLAGQGIQSAIFGDIFLEDLKKYREQKLATVGLSAVFPLWNQSTPELIRDFLAAGFKAITVCVDASLLDESYVGRIIDEDFLQDLPDRVDPCGENGEFHTFVFDGPIFKDPIPFKVGEKVFREYLSGENPAWNTRFWYCDLLPVR